MNQLRYFTTFKKNKQAFALKCFLYTFVMLTNIFYASLSFSTTLPPTPSFSGTKKITVQPKDTLSSIFKRAGLSAKNLQEVLLKNPYQRQLTHLKPKQTLELVIQHNQLMKLSMPYSPIQTLYIEQKNHHYQTTLKTNPTHTQEKIISGIVQGSLYNTARRYNIPYTLIQQMTTIFNRQMNFTKDLRTGDRFVIIYHADYIGQKLVRTGEIMAVQYTRKQHVYQAIRHEFNHQSEYFTPEGQSLKQAFSRYPVQFSHISSMFSLSRMHPILRYRRPHQGVDLVAPIGTPVHATGDGRIETLQYHSTYGNMIKIDHQNTYASIYAHLHHFQKGLSRGAYVKRGQVIGYVGQTGLADGPHCHYEFRIHNLPINPSTVILPQGAPIPKSEQPHFKKIVAARLLQMKRFNIASAK